MRRKRNPWPTALSLLICLVHILPFYILLTTSFKAADDLSSKWVMPGYMYADNFKNAWQEANLPSAFRSNLIVTIVSVALIIVVGSVAAYPLARFQTRWNKFVYAVFVSALIVPPLTILVPLYKFMVDIGGMNQYWGIILLFVTFNLPMTIFLYTGFIGTIPRELDEAAMIDGAGRLGLFYRILLPLLKPITATVVILTGVAVWNDYQFSVFFLQHPHTRTITVALAAFFGQYNSNIGWVAAGSLMGALPMIVLYLFLQRYFISGLASGAIKG
ncbi:raffinose/stachyose/melibiose transport system permease protein [Paenibacillus sp. UNC496MF]|uniref:carbohydrate ABC transporter permease n=1 Tax=Paenibacillus sp. UNC496MF TaxID=1502753 RepID=UPI0008E18715|nr:carbohydrate ABC transporter permease [Paenibacillus sp. UNC496MF]SFI34717.1 raffinose/stachyose/melibiose transport system permease protein [Paenibacillus sp. UNC496MF]